MASLEELAAHEEKPAGNKLEDLAAAEAAPKQEYPLDKFVKSAIPVAQGLGRRVAESANPIQQLRSLFNGEASGNPFEIGGQTKPAAFADRSRSAAQGATLNHADEAVSGLDSLFGKKTYEEALAENRPTYEKAVKNAPAEYFGAAIASPNPLSKLSLPAKMGVGGRALSTVAQGAAGGALAAEGGSNEALRDTGPEVLDAAKGGGAIGLGGSVVAEALRGLSPALRKAAEEKAFQSFGARVDLGAAKNKLKAIDARAPAGDPTAARRELGRVALDEKLVRPLGTAGGVADKAADAVEQAGSIQGGLIDTIQDAHPQAAVNELTLADMLKNRGAGLQYSVDTAALGRGLEGRSKDIQDAVARRMTDGGAATRSLREAERIKKALQGEQNYSHLGADQSAQSAAGKETASAYRQAVEDEVERVAGPDELEPWLAAKKKTGRLNDILDVAQYGAQREATKGEGSSILGNARLALRHGQSTGQWLLDHGLDQAEKLWKQRRPATLANIYDEGARIAKGPTASRLASRGGSLAEYLDLLKEKEE